MKLTNFVTAGLMGFAMATATFAASDGNSSSTTVKNCKNGQVYDEKKKKCVEVDRGMFTDDFLYKTARALAYDGQFENAINLLELAQNPDDPRVLNYLGFSHRKAGRTEVAMGYYNKALEIDPNYNLARSYLGQGLLAVGNKAAAKEQLVEIANRGGMGSWAYVMLENALETNVTY